MKLNLLKNYKYILLLIFSFGIVLIFWILFSFLSYPASNPEFKKDNKAKLENGFPVYQKFTAKKDGLSQINFYLGNPELKFGEKIHLMIKDENCDTTIREDSLGFLSPGPRIYEKFKFPRIEDSREKTYCFYVVFETKDIDRDDNPYIAASDQPQFKGFSYVRTEKNREYKNRSLIMKPAYENESFTDNFKELINRMSQYKPLFFKGYFLTTIIILSILLSILLVLVLILL